MQRDTNQRQYEQALNLAESGQYEQALDAFMTYLKGSPDDGKAYSDVGTILFCLQRGQEAVRYFENALQLCQGDEKSQVYWNLCEVYIQDGNPDKAVEIFNLMHREELLNPDMVNRTANCFLRQNNLGKAMEILRLSLKISPQQEILKPMLQAIRAKRKHVCVVAREGIIWSQMLATSLNDYMPTKRYMDLQVTEEVIRDSDMIVFAGLCRSLIETSSICGSQNTIVVLSEQDIYHPSINQINFSSIQAVIACAPSGAIMDLKERSGQVPVIRGELVPNVNDFSCHEKKRGKRIAAIGPWNARKNPMLLLQCFQKLHYIDSDYRLYFAGGFEDPGLERYVNNMIETMDLQNEVIIDSTVKSMTKWVKDKHFIVSTAIDSGSVSGVWFGATCGLRPVVHRYAGAQESFSEEFIFDLAEDFCEQILDDRYEPNRYRDLASERFARFGIANQVHLVLSDIEKQMFASSPQSSTQQETESCRINHSLNQSIQQIDAVSKSLQEIPAIHELTNKTNDFKPIVIS